MRRASLRAADSSTGGALVAIGYGLAVLLKGVQGSVPAQHRSCHLDTHTPSRAYAPEPLAGRGGQGRALGPAVGAKHRPLLLNGAATI
jgi:hypothetical protein